MGTSHGRPRIQRRRTFLAVSCRTTFYGRVTVFRTLCTIVLSLVLVGACAVPAFSQRTDPFDIDVILPMTGLLGFNGQSGANTVRQVEVAVNKTGGIRGRPVRFVIKDDQSNPTVAVQLMNDAVNKKAPIVLGSMLGATCAAMAPIAQNGPVHFCYSPAIHPAAGSYSFSGGPSTEAFGPVLLRYMRARGWKTFALLTSTDASGQDGDNAFVNAAKLPENSGLQMVAHEKFNPTDISVAAQVARMKAANPQVIIAYTLGNPLGVALRGIHDAGIDLPVFTGPGNQTLALLKQYTDIMPKELYFPCFPVLCNAARNAKERAAQARFLTAQHDAGIMPDAPSVSTWDFTLMAVDALRALGTNATADQVRQYVGSLHDYYGVYGIYDFRDGSQRGLNGEQNLLVARWDPAKTYWVTVSDFGGAVRSR